MTQYKYQLELSINLRKYLKSIDFISVSILVHGFFRGQREKKKKIYKKSVYLRVLPCTKKKFSDTFQVQIRKHIQI